MDKIRIVGGNTLKGRIPISGAKNAALPLMCASLLTEGTLTLTNMPYLADIITLTRLLMQHGVSLNMHDSLFSSEKHFGHTVALSGKNITSLTAPYELVRTMRASVLVLGPLLARFGSAKVSLPGGCAIGSRPIDLHLKALEALGAQIELSEGYVHACVNGRLKGAEIYFDKVSVGATENLLMAAALADGVTVLANAAREPEVTDLAECLVKMGAIIEGIGTDRLVITGVDILHGADHKVVADRIEAGTYMTAAAMTGGDIELLGASASTLGSVIEKYEHAGVIITETDKGLRVQGSSEIKGVDMMTLPFPSFPTDMQAQFMALMSLAQGASMITETIFENRFMHVPELVRMGANINVQGRSAMVRGVAGLKGAEVMATDLRASSSLILAALAAEGETIIHRVYHLDRGYEALEEKLAACGADISRMH
jgi:UDP-N-acetylglucosamine 1-carboxyvinyltransferase